MAKFLNDYQFLKELQTLLENSMKIENDEMDKLDLLDENINTSKRLWRAFGRIEAYIQILKRVDRQLEHDTWEE